VLSVYICRTKKSPVDTTVYVIVLLLALLAPAPKKKEEAIVGEVKVAIQPNQGHVGSLVM
jgi:hypothetical protein